MLDAQGPRDTIPFFQQYRKSLLIFLLFVVYAGVVFWSSYASLRHLRESALVQFRLETEKQASAISYYFSERRSDVFELAESGVVLDFFRNSDLGMSYQYGLGLNVQLIESSFERLNARKQVAGQSVYLGFMVLDRDGKPIAKWNPPEIPEGLERWQNPDNHEIRTRLWSQQGDLLISAPIWINRIYRGEMLAWIKANTSLAQFGDSYIGGRNLLIDRDTAIPLSPGNYVS